MTQRSNLRRAMRKEGRYKMPVKVRKVKSGHQVRTNGKKVKKIGRTQSKSSVRYFSA